MEIAIMAGLLAKWDVDVNAGHNGKGSTLGGFKQLFKISQSAFKFVFAFLNRFQPVF